MTIVDFLNRLGACSEAVEWAERYRTLEQLWYSCHRIEWMLWMLEQIGYRDEARLRTFAVRCARRNEALLTGSGSGSAIAAAERAARYGAVSDDLRAARVRGRQAAEEAARHPGWSQARAAAATAAWLAARESPLQAARGTSLFALRAVEWNVDASATRQDEEVWQTDLLRALVEDDVATIRELTLRKARQVASQHHPTSRA